MLMKKTLIIGIIYLFVNTSCKSQDRVFDRNESVKMEILNKEIKFLKSDSIILLNLKVENDLDSAMIFYNFSDIEMGGSNPEFSKQPNQTCGTDVFINNSQKEHYHVQLINYGTRLRDFPGYYNGDSLINYTHKSKIVVSPKASLNTTIQIQPKKKFLKPGRYTLFLIYYSGYNVHNVIDAERNKQEKAQHKAANFYGYMVSNTVVLEVE